MPQTNSISIQALSNRLGGPDWPRVIDIRIPEDLNADPWALPASEYCAFRDIASLSICDPQEQVVIACQKGLKLSQGAAAILRARGTRALHLECGEWGWRDAGLPLIPLDALPNWMAGSRPSWVTSTRPGLEALACAWVIRRFIVPNPVVLFVDADQVKNVADRFDAEAFGTKEGSLKSLCETHELDHYAFQQLSSSGGLQNIVSGLKAIHSDDLELTELVMPVFDGLYRANRSGCPND